MRNSTEPEMVAVRDTSVLVGNAYGRLEVMGEADGLGRGGKLLHQVRVRCSCGNEKVVGAASLVSGDALSCGCWERELDMERIWGRVDPLHWWHAR